MTRMYPEEDREQNIRRREYLVDMYLNMPDKGGGDTPLHLASKWGHLEMVRLLCSYHQTRLAMSIERVLASTVFLVLFIVHDLLLLTDLIRLEQGNKFGEVASQVKMSK